MASDKFKRSSRRQLSFEGSVSNLESTRTEQCKLCHGCNTNMSIPEKWISEPARNLVVSLGVSLTCTICSVCRKDVTRCLGDDAYIPRWDKCTNTKSMCCVSECTDVMLASLRKPKELIQSALNELS